MGGADVNSPNFPTNKLDNENSDELSAQFDRSITFVRNYTRSIERDYAQPLLKICYAYSQRRPISAVFIGFFALLSFLPIISFMYSGISLLTTVVLTTIALVAAFIASAGIVLGLLAVLLAVLTATFFTSICLSLVAISSFLFLRLFILVRREGAPGFSYWVGEIKALAMGAGTNAVPKQAVNGIEETSAPTLEGRTPEFIAGSSPRAQEAEKQAEEED